MAKKDRITDIINHIKLADESEATASEHNWAAAQLIWEEVDDGATQKSIAAAIGKSETHVSFMRKCWEVKVASIGLTGFALSDLGSFYEVYNSVEVRGESAARDRGTGPGSGGGHLPGREPEETSGTAMITKAANLLDTVARNPGYWDMLTDDDLAVLNEAIGSANTIIEGCG
jgi:hypothetical protein